MTKWNIVYRLLAELLLEFQQNHPRSPRKALYLLLNQSDEFKSINRWFSLFTKHNRRESIDPFQLFVCINNRQQTDSLRIKNINVILSLLGLDYEYSEIDFNGCPSIPNINLSLPKPEQDQNDIWNCFIKVVRYGRSGLTKKVFNRISSLQRLNIQVFSVFLFWIDTKSFIPLNRITEDALLARGLLSDNPDPYESYVALLQAISGDEIEKLVFPLHKYSAKVKIADAATEAKSVVKVEQSQPEAENFTKGFRVIAIRLQKETERLTKVLKPGLYQFYRCFDFTNSDYITYESQKDLAIYGHDPSINVSAIVGNNGSGKSTLSELLYAAINNLARHQGRLNKDLIKVNKLELELYFLTDSLYRASFSNEKIIIERYQLSENRYEKPLEVPFEMFNFERFFYTIGINYSHYALNSLHIGKWIDRLFHKNDGYQTPLVINPYRKLGNINVNNEYDLTRSRLLSIILEPVPIDEQGIIVGKNLREFADGKYAEVLEFKLNKYKFGKNYTVNNFTFKLDEKDPQWSETISIIYKTFNISNEIKPILPGKPLSWRLFVNNYLLRKLVNIIIRYRPYQVYHDKKTNHIVDIDNLLNNIKKDSSHITFKFQQAINFLKYYSYHLPNIELVNGIYKASVEEMGIAIAQIKADYPKENYKTIQLIPPSFFDTEIELNNAEHFKDLSSGEKQRIYTVSSLIYHLVNISSIQSRKGSVRHRNVNVVFDEVELYFHPEMQREFIAFLLDYLKRVELNISGLNFQFITHSPFILSDIPLYNILFLQPDKLLPDFEPTLGANIHDMLAHNFFLNKGFMGEHTKNKIKSLTKFLKDNINEDNWDDVSSQKFIDALGEPLIHDRLKIMFEVKFNQHIDQQIKDLEIELNRLKSEKNKGLKGASADS